MSSIKTERGTLTRTRTAGPALYFASVAGDETRAIVGIVHGYADYGERYENVQRAWAERGVASVAIDLRGHGRAEGPRGACKKWDEYYDDLEELFALLESRGAEHPKFLFGHSFGGLLAHAWALRKPDAQKGLLLSNPYMRTALPLPAAKRAAGKIVSAICPSMGLSAGIRGDQLTRDAALAKKYEDDPLVFKKANVRWFTEAEGAQERAFAHANELTLPLYMVLGTSDPVVSGGREIFELASSKDKTLDIREGLLHEVLNEPEWPSIAGAMADWVLERA